MDWPALGKAVVRRRVEMGFDSRKGFAVSAELGERNLSDIEHGRRESYDPGYLVKLEQALRWPPGTIDAILNGLPAPEPRPRKALSPFGAHVLTAMRAASIDSTATLAREAHLSGSALHRLLYGDLEPSHRILHQLAVALKVPEDDLAAKAFPDGEPLGMPIPPSIARLIEARHVLPEDLQAKLDDRIGWVTEWAEYVAREPERRRGAG